jgi:hypothetical protein
MVIVSGDYGELGTAMYFVKGLPATPCPMLMVPAPLVHTMPAMPGMDVRTYSNVNDIARMVEQIEPDVALLASGYLFAINAGLTLGDSLRLVRMLHRRRVTILTSDPFLGMLGSPMSIDFRDLIDNGHKWRSALKVAWRIKLPIFVMRYLLRDAWHVYPGPIERLHASRNERRLSYFNPLCQEPGESKPLAPAERPTWLFVISRVDYEMHLRQQGPQFVEQIVDRLRDTLALGRRARLIGPGPLVRAVRTQLGDPPDASFYSDTLYNLFMENLMGAEYVFFWNYYSFSVIHRVLASRPTFFFHEGHMVHILPALKQAGVRLFYSDWRPPLLSLGAPLNQDELERQAEQITKQFHRIADDLHRCPSPLELLRLVVGAPEGGKGGT